VAFLGRVESLKMKMAVRKSYMDFRSPRLETVVLLPQLTTKKKVWSYFDRAGTNLRFIIHYMMQARPYYSSGL